MADTGRGILDIVPASHHDLLTAPGTAVLTTIDRHGRPQSTAAWYLVDRDGLLKLSSTADRQKIKNLRANPSCTFFLMDPANPFRTLEVRAEAELVADTDFADLKRFTEAYGREPRVLGDERFTIVLRPRRIVANPPARQS
ncbi:PPOX class probable F420-dependent enzyme [Amycolatopsis sacchari]|uniref:PPOX class probable F420-dependent enzyme n=1 Tax=Amycolatopsis sacchari TaxID=115433 RepID=A0A1I3JB37_9PSEU|nr:PPOX class F420-dependent oxidoreductase [Amycolatopsis sacchari]SFI57464.1 PPOX class probable F420-dependent enzyme [Amycolatopsis sacchari]